MIKRYRAFDLIEQVNTNQGPVYSICVENDTFEKFYVKYIYRENHYDSLVYEVLLTSLASYFGLNRPDIALIDVPEDIFNDVEVNNPFFYGGIVGFGSKDLSNAFLLVAEQGIHNKFDYNRYANPIDIVKILLLDLHCDNRDRHDGNFNILIEPEHYDFYVFDHYDCFGGTPRIGNIDPSLPLHYPGSIFQSEFFRKICKWLELEDIEECIEEYITLANDTEEIVRIVQTCINDIPDEWDISDTLQDDLINYLTDSERIKSLESTYLKIVGLKQRMI